MQDVEAVQNEIVGQAHVENYALKLFLYADNEDRAARFGKYVASIATNDWFYFFKRCVLKQITNEVLPKSHKIFIMLAVNQPLAETAQHPICGLCITYTWCAHLLTSIQLQFQKVLIIKEFQLISCSFSVLKSFGVSSINFHIDLHKFLHGGISGSFTHLTATTKSYRENEDFRNQLLIY